MSVSAAILAGGLSRRMGSDKALLPLGGTPMALRIARTLKRVTGDDPFLVAKSPRKYEHLGLFVVRDAFRFRCSLSGIHAALRHVRTGRALITTCDQPFLSADLIKEMIRTPGDVVACEVNHHLAPFPCIFSADLLEAIADSFEYGILSVQENMYISGFPAILDERHVRSLDPALRTFMNLNRPEDFDFSNASSKDATLTVRA